MIRHFMSMLSGSSAASVVTTSDSSARPTSRPTTTAVSGARCSSRIFCNSATWVTRDFDAGLLIGDPAFEADHAALGLEKIDLGLEWTKLTGLPFVYAAWTGRAGAVTREDVRLLQEAGIQGAAARLDSYPHEFSGGMRQRVVLALALCAEPELLIADEPTTALDVSIQAQIIALLRRLCRERGTAMLLITHDMGVIAEMADRVAVMYAGRIVEIGPVRDVVHRPHHPYTQGLMGSIPTLDSTAPRLTQIPGSMPRLTAIPSGCAFHPRCQHAFARCLTERPERMAVDQSEAACWLLRERARGAAA